MSLACTTVNSCPSCLKYRTTRFALVYSVNVGICAIVTDTHTG